MNRSSSVVIEMLEVYSAALQEICDWRMKQHDMPNRPEAIRRLVATGLALWTKASTIGNLVLLRTPQKAT